MKAKDLADDLIALGNIIRQQLPYKNRIWLGGVTSGIGTKIGPTIKSAIADIKKHERDGRAVTWPRNAVERRASLNTIGVSYII